MTWIKGKKWSLRSAPIWHSNEDILMSKYPISGAPVIHHLTDYSGISFLPHIPHAHGVEIKCKIIGHLSYWRKLKCPWVFLDRGEWNYNDMTKWKQVRQSLILSQCRNIRSITSKACPVCCLVTPAHNILLSLCLVSLFAWLFNSVINHPVTVTKLLLIVISQLPCLIAFIPWFSLFHRTYIKLPLQ